MWNKQSSCMRVVAFMYRHYDDMSHLSYFARHGSFSYLMFFALVEVSLGQQYIYSSLLDGTSANYQIKWHCHVSSGWCYIDKTTTEHTTAKAVSIFRALCYTDTDLWLRPTKHRCDVNGPVAHIPQWTCTISCNTPFRSINVHTCANFCYQMHVPSAL